MYREDNIVTRSYTETLYDSRWYKFARLLHIYRSHILMHSDITLLMDYCDLNLINNINLNIEDRNNA